MKLFGMILHEFQNEDNIRNAKFEDHIPYYKLWKKLGASFHHRAEKDSLEFRFATFTIFRSYRITTQKVYLKISILFLKKDIGIGIYH